MHFGGLGGSRWSSLDTVLMTPNMTAAFTQSYTRLKYARPTENNAVTLISQPVFCYHVTLCQTCQKVTDLEPSRRGASAASGQWGWWGCTRNGRGRPPQRWLPGESGPADWYSTSPTLSWSGLTCWPAGGSRHTSQIQRPLHPYLQLMESTMILLLMQK